MSDRAHLSIGEVLNLLREDFPDITISKIRFLESQGLLDPERTKSGYRKFYEPDIERLRWILRQQRENFLPLKVIKDRLASGDVDYAEDISGAAATDDLHSIDPSLLQEAPTPRPSRARTAAPNRGQAEPPPPPPPLFEDGESDETTVSLTLDELMSTTGLSAREVDELQKFGMLSSRSLGNTAYFDEDALLVARLAASFRSHGVEARHLRMYKVSAEREAGVFEQLLMPMLHKRNPQARRDVAELVNELASLGDGLRTAMLRKLLREYLSGS